MNGRETPRGSESESRLVWVSNLRRGAGCRQLANGGPGSCRDRGVLIIGDQNSLSPNDHGLVDSQQRRDAPPSLIRHQPSDRRPPHHQRHRHTPAASIDYGHLAASGSA